MSEKPKHTGSKTEASAGAKSAKDASIALVRKARLNDPDLKELIAHIKAGNKTALSRAITLIESNAEKHREQAKAIIKACFGPSKSRRIGITGVPGVGKSTFIAKLGVMLTQKGHRVDVLALDPSSSVSGGSILGDKTRMHDLAQSDLAFIRPTPSKLTLGGVAKHTRESIILCEAAGYDLILIETVGVGQSETAVHGLCDFFLLLQLAGAGDELQGIKRGIIEMADAIAVNKADDQAQSKSAQSAQMEYQRALSLFPRQSNGWQPKAVTCSALMNIGISDIWNMIQEFVSLTQSNGSFEKKRTAQNLIWMEKTLDENLKETLLNHPEIQDQWRQLKTQVARQKINPVAAAERLMTQVLKARI